MNTQRIQNIAFSLALASGLFYLTGCTGDTGGDSKTGADLASNQFVATDSTVGTIELSLNSDDIPVSQTSGFTVTVKNPAGAPVPQIPIACDTESGLALIDPTTGSELTSSFGTMSGKVGCSAPGSFEMACRLPIGGNKRKFVTVHCTGEIPSGFAGFTGAGGGGLGGGVAVPPGGTGGSPGGTDPGDTTRIAAIDFYDGGDVTTASPSIDTVQGLCGTEAPFTAEPFFDTQIGITVTNSSNSTVQFTSATISVPDVSGSTVKSGDLALIGDAVVAPDGTQKSFFILAFKASGGVKYFYDNPTGTSSSSTQIPTDLGFRAVIITLTGTDSQGDSVVISGSSSASFSNFNKCEA